MSTISPRDGLARKEYDAIIVGSGPNGLAAAVTLALRGRTVAVIEAEPTFGGGARSAELTLPGFVHDICSAIHPMGVASPFFRSLDLTPFGLEWVHPTTPAAHPLDDGTAALLELSLDATAARLGEDGQAYTRLMKPLADHWEWLLADTLGPPRPPRHPLLLMKFGLRGLRSAVGLARSLFTTPHAQGLFTGIAAHATLPLDNLLTASVGLMLTVCGHGAGWPMARGGTQQITNALLGLLRSHGGEAVAGWRISSLAELPPARAVLFDVAPRNLVQICGSALPVGYRRRLLRFRHGPASFKLDWALDGPIPWRAAECARAGTVHLGGTLDEVAAAERSVWRGEHSERPYVLIAQQTLFDPTRAPAGRHTAWAYCHVPAGSTVDRTEAIERQVERFAPGFRDRILARSVLTPRGFETHNANYIGGDITGGVMDAWQVFARPVVGLNPYATPNPRVFLCSSSTPPGPGVHGMCGYHAANAALRSVLR